MSNKANSQTAPDRKQKRARAILNIAGVLSILAICAWLATYLGYFKGNEVTDDAQVEGYITPVNARIGGYIKEIRFSEHQPVHKGDTLLLIDDRELRVAQQQAEAAYLEATAGRGVMASSVTTVNNNVSVADANLAELEARVAFAETNYQRYQNLLQDESISRQQFEQVKVEYDAIKAKYEALKRQRRSTEFATGEVKQRLNVSEASILRAKAAMDMASINLGYTVVTAPYDGFTGRLTLQEGQLVQPGQALVALVRSDKVWIVANFREKQMSEIHEGVEVTVKIDALEGRSFTGKVSAISHATGSKYSLVQTDNSAGNFVKVQQRIPVKIEFTAANRPEDIRQLRTGMNAVVAVKKS
jgi:membrane fusion protein (multidrug efflux system)